MSSFFDRYWPHTGTVPPTTQQASARLLCTNLPQEVTDDVLSVLFQQCVPSFQSIHRVRPDRSSNQIPGAAIRTSGRIPSSQRCRSAGKNGSNLLRDTWIGCSGQGKLGWVRFEEGLGHDRLIYLIPARLMTFRTSNHSIALRSESMTVGGLQEGGIHIVSARRMNSGTTFTDPCPPRGLRRSARQEERALSCQRDRTVINQLRSPLIPFSGRTSCTNRKKCR